MRNPPPEVSTLQQRPQLLHLVPVSAGCWWRFVGFGDLHGGGRCQAAALRAGSAAMATRNQKLAQHIPLGVLLVAALGTTFACPVFFAVFWPRAIDASVGSTGSDFRNAQNDLGISHHFRIGNRLTESGNDTRLV